MTTNGTQPVNPFVEQMRAAENASVAVARPLPSPADIDAPITGGEMAILFRLAKGLAASGMFKDAKQAEQAFAKLIFGRDLGLSATQAMTDIHIVEGKPEMSANLQASKVRSSDRYEYSVLELTNERCEIEFSLEGQALTPISVFTIEDAKTAGLVKDASAWKKYPRNMLFARAMSNGVAWHCPDVMNGIRVYAEGEIQPHAFTAPATAEVDEPQDAEVVDDDNVLGDEQRAELVAAFDAAGVNIDMFLTAVGVDATEDLTEQTAFMLREKLGEHLQRENAGAAQ